MTGKTHQLLGLTVGVGTFLLLAKPEYNPATLGAVLVGSHLAALLPDIDQPAARIWSHLPFGWVAGELMNPFLKHRNLTHSLLGMLIVAWFTSIGLAFFPAYWGIHTSSLYLSILAAYASHLIADMVTVEGIPLFWPYQRMYGIPPRPFQGFRIMTGQWFEDWLIFPLINLAFVLLLVQQWPTIKVILFH